MVTEAITVSAPAIVKEEIQPSKQQKFEYKLEIYWTNVVYFIMLHVGAFYGIYLVFTSAKLLTTVYSIIIYMMTIIGITAGVHRLWSHRAYKAKFPLKVILMLLNTMAYQNSIYEWARDHRVHHKFSETDADPVNATRGFFFSHVGWLLCKKHPDIREKGKSVDMSDLLADPIVAFQKKHYFILMLLFCWILPVLPPIFLWGESYATAYFVPVLLRYVCGLHATWLVNSAAHLYGRRPYDKSINPSQNILANVVSLGEGWHNFHHVFPWDYKAAELGTYKNNITTAIIDFCYSIGWAYDLKTVSHDVVKQRVHRTGDGTHNVWGWGDKDQTIENKQTAIIVNHVKCQ